MIFPTNRIDELLKEIGKSNLGDAMDSMGLNSEELSLLTLRVVLSMEASKANELDPIAKKNIPLTCDSMMLMFYIGYQLAQLKNKEAN